jgi:hypothetical protein
MLDTSLGAVCAMTLPRMAIGCCFPSAFRTAFPSSAPPVGLSDDNVEVIVTFAG